MDAHEEKSPLFKKLFVACRSVFRNNASKIMVVKYSKIVPLIFVKLGAELWYLFGTRNAGGTGICRFHLIMNQILA